MTGLQLFFFLMALVGLIILLSLGIYYIYTIVIGGGVTSGVTVGLGIGLILLVVGFILYYGYRNNVQCSSQQIIEEPICQQPVYQQPVCQQPVYQQSVYQQPVCQQPNYQVQQIAVPRTILDSVGGQSCGPQINLSQGNTCPFVAQPPRKKIREIDIVERPTRVRIEETAPKITIEGDGAFGDDIPDLQL